MNGPTLRGRLVLTALVLTGLVAAYAAPPPPAPSKPKFTFVPLGTLGGTWSTAEGINDFRDVVGVSALADGSEAPFLYTAATNAMQDLNVMTDGPLDLAYQSVFGPDRNGDNVADLYVVSRGNYPERGSRVDVFDGLTGHFLVNLIPPNAPELLCNTGYMSISPDGDLFIPSGPVSTTTSQGVTGRNRVLRYDGATGAYLGEFVAPGSGGLSGINGVTFGSDVNGDNQPDFFLASHTTSEVLVYDGADGTFLDVFVPAGSGGLNGVGNLIFRDMTGDSVPDLVVCSRISAAILIYSSVDGSFLEEFVPPQLDSGEFLQMAFGPDGDLYVGSAGSENGVRRFDGTNGDLIGVFVANGANGHTGAAFITFDAAGALLLSSPRTNQIMKFQGPYDASPGAFVEIFVDGVAMMFKSPRDINNAGQIVGGGFPQGRWGNFNEVAAFRYTPPAPGDEWGNAIDLNLPGTTFEEATAINDNGDVAGHYLSPSDGKIHGFLWRVDTGAAMDLNSALAGYDTYVTGVSNRSDGWVYVFGYTNTTSGYRGVRWYIHLDQEMLIGFLGGISGSNGYAYVWDVNNAGTVTGQASVNGYQHAFTCAINGSKIDLGTLGGRNSYGYAINDAGTVVGTSDTSNTASKNKFQAFMRTSANGMFALEPQITNLPSSMQLKIRPHRINTAGAICGPGEFDPVGTAFLLTPQ